MTTATSGRARSAVPWLFALAGLLTILSPLVLVGFWVADGGWVALAAFVADLLAALLAAVTATVLAAQRGVRRVRTVVSGHPGGRAGRLAEHHAARWQVARQRFGRLQGEYAAYEADPRAVAARPALCDVTVPSTARFVQAYADAEYLVTDTEPVGPRREEFALAVDRAVAAWHDAVRVADGLAASSPAVPHETRAVEPPRHPGSWTTAKPSSEYAEAADALRRAGARGVADLRRRMRA